LFADSAAHVKAHSTFKNIDLFPVTEIGTDGEERDIGFDETNGFTEWPYPDGTLCIGLLRMQAKYSPRFAALELRIQRLYVLTDDIEIIDLTGDAPSAAAGPSSTPESTPKKRPRPVDVEETDRI
jgi:hypothetical protein